MQSKKCSGLYNKMILGNGIDIIEIERIKKAIDRWGDHFLDHIFNDVEIQYCKEHRNAAQHFAVRFAAKEAVFKAVGDQPQLSWKDITVTNDTHGKPVATLKDKEYPNKIHLSLSHSNDYAIASAIISS